MKLNLGSGTGHSASFFFARDYINIDRQTGGEIYPVSEIAKDGKTQIPVGPGSCSEIRASHCLEHLSFRKTMDVLRHWVSLLKPGGVLKIAVPDFEWIARHYIASVDEDAPNENVTGYLMGGQTDENDYHKAIFDVRGLTAGMEAAGLVDIKPWTSETDDCASLEVSLNLQGTKPGQAVDNGGWNIISKSPESPLPDRSVNDANHGEHPDHISHFMATSEDQLPANTIVFNPEEIACVLSVPRLGFMSNMQCLLTVANLGIQVRMQQGAFWGQCLTDAMLQFMEDEKYKYILTVDYDSIFTAEDVLGLYRYMASPGAEWIHALTTVQVRRENDLVLLSMVDEHGQPRGTVMTDELQKDVVKVRTAHFGLTLFRVDALKRTPHPWFLDVPDAEGKWGDGKIDCDISFWLKFQEAGNSLYLAPRIVIGHLEQVASWPQDDFTSRYQKMKDYQKHGKPDWAWK